MTQRRVISAIETILSTLIGFGVALLTQIVVFPWFGFNPPLHENVMISVVFTIVSIVRGYCVRRLFNWLEHIGHFR
jgi:hypothetical protein